MRISDWSSDVCSSDLPVDSAVLPIDTAFKHDRIVSAINCGGRPAAGQQGEAHEYTDTWDFGGAAGRGHGVPGADRSGPGSRCRRALVEFPGGARSEEHTSELQSLMRCAYAFFCLN